MENTPLFKKLEKTSIGLIHRVYLSLLKTSRKYLASTKTRAEIRGGGRKPWKQKGTGKARAGSSRSPLWVGGGVIFGPKPRLVYKKVNKKERRLAILSTFYLKSNSTIILQNSVFNMVYSLKTKNIFQLLNFLDIPPADKILFILPKKNISFWLAARNFKNITLTTANCLNLPCLLETRHILLSQASIETIHSIYGKKTRESF